MSSKKGMTIKEYLICIDTKLQAFREKVEEKFDDIDKQFTNHLAHHSKREVSFTKIWITLLGVAATIIAALIGVILRSK